MATTTLSKPAALQPKRAAGTAPSRRPKTPLSRMLATVIVSVLAVAWLVPFAWATVTALKSETDAASTPISWIPASGFTLDAFAKVLQSGNIPTWTLNSLFTSAAITAITLVISASVAYAISRIDFRGKRMLMGVIVASIIIPPPVLIIPLFQQMQSLNLIDTYWALILPQVIHSPMVFVLKKFFDQIPRELEEAALMDGAGRLRIFTTIVLPLSRPILAAVAIFVFIGAWNNFLWPFIATNESSLLTLPVGLQTIKSAYGIQYAQNMASALLAALPLIVVFLFFQRQIIRGVATTGLAGT
ncbi:multiple sugar transport system permease protein [Arthrobacter sp. PvP102]|uniref:carbohydrate ABC transporter permease n=1 Tax=unclassified Arthrobacter TaxID=235627 RepID=UPI001AE2F4EA|nr:MULTISPECIES: carbohydrate ABC transporter permease [unclassified Arthrobacter]MBP1233200.1 multiple sugar transport system permease protein [Arthrobacter sp. PvP103]MBP1238335.1 multiple sugar transport system permease protein [Arthrobacter sp. PvP102]